jgi:hypothetical protein
MRKQQNNLTVMKYNGNKFSIAQMFSNTADGKTSGSAVLGLSIGVAGIFGFVFGVIHFAVMKDPAIMSQSVIVMSVAAGLLGVRKMRDGNHLPGSLDTCDEQRDDDTQPSAVVPPAVMANTTVVATTTTETSQVPDMGGRPGQ